MKAEEFCAYIRQIRKDAGLSITTITKKYPWHRNTIGNYEKDRLSDIDYLFALSREANVSLNELLTERLKAGLLSDDEEINSYSFSLANKLSDISSNSDEQFEKIEMPDSSMEPLIQEGAELEINKRDTEVKLGKYYYVDIAGVKTVVATTLGADGIAFYQDNSGTQLVIYESKYGGSENNGKRKVIGRVVSVKNKL